MSDLLTLALARRQSRAALHVTWLDGGTLEIYGGFRPGTPDTAVTDQTMLCTFTFDEPAGEATGAIIVAELPEPALVVEAGIATWARAKDDQGDVVWDGDVGLPESGSVVELSNTSLVSGAYVRLTAIQIVE